MEKYVSCYALTGKCYFVAKDETEDGTLERIREHIEHVHDMAMNEEIKVKALELMREVA